MSPPVAGGRGTVAAQPRVRSRSSAPLTAVGVAALLVAAAAATASGVCGLRGFVAPGELSPVRRPRAPHRPPPSPSPSTAASRVPRQAIMDPPTRYAPPETSDATLGGQMPWIECVIEECEAGVGSCRRMESWVFRKEHATDYGSFMDIRNIEPSGFLPGRLDYGRTNLRASVSCRERSVDSSLRCAECIRLVKGGPYGARGVAVGAYPQQAEVVPCLKLSKSLPKYEPQEGERFDSNSEDPRQTAFCNTINAKL